ncbi:hypothetical protein STEG23_029581 [Scotinomys teguina]
MVSLAYHDQDFVHLDNSQQQTTNNSLLKQFTSQPVAKEQSQNTVTVTSSFNKKSQSLATLPSPKSKVRQGSSTGAMKSSSLHSKHLQKDPYSKSPLNPSWKSLDSSLSHLKPQTTSSSSYSGTSSSEPSQITVISRLPLPKPQTSSAIDLCWKSSLLESTQRVSTSSSSALQCQETPSLNIIWSSPPLKSSKSEPNSTLYKSRLQRQSSLDYLWSSLLKPNQKTVSSPPFNHKLQRNDSPSTLSSPESSRTAQNSPLPECKSLKSPASNSNNNVLSLPLSQVKSRKPPLSSHSSHPSHSLSVCQPKPKTALRSDRSTQALSSPVCHSKVQRTTSPTDKHRVRQIPSVHPKPNMLGQSVSSPKLCTKKKNASVPSPRLQSKGNIEQNLKSEPENEVPWSLNYSYPCIIKGGTVPLDVVNKIVNSISKSTIQKDLARQILFRRMRGKPNPRPGPRLSSTYTVCLECGSCIKSQCSHLTGKKDPRCATLFVIPTPESSADGKVDVKIVLILSLPETSSSCYQLPMKDDQPEDNSEALDGNLEELEKITQFFPASESGCIQGIQTNQKCLAVSSEDSGISQQPQAVDWLLYVKNRNTIQPQVPVQASSSSSSSSSSSCSSYSSSSSSTGFPSPHSTCKDPTPAPLPSYILAKVLSHIVV